MPQVSESVFDVPGFSVLRGMHAGGMLLPRHTHDDPSLCYVFEGCFTEHSGGRSFECREDTLKLTVAGDPHSNRFIADESHGLRVDIDRAHFEATPLVHRLLGERFFLERSGAGALLHRVRHEMAFPDAMTPLAVESALLELLARLAREAERSEAAIPSWLRRAHEMVEASYATRLTLGGVAREVGVPATSLARAYRRRFRTSIGERVRMLRVEQAARALAYTDEPLTVIAANCGFYDQSHFSNVFRREYGVSPMRYRQQARTGRPA